MREKIKTFLMDLDLYDHFKIVKDNYFRSKTEKLLCTKRYDFYKQIIRPGDLCFDVGANYGNRTEVFLSLNARVISVEPQPLPIKYLERKFRDKIVLVPNAVGASISKSEMYLSKDSPLSSLSADWISAVSKNRFKHVSWQKKIEVEVTTLDHLIEIYGKPDFCKIDVEGFELEVIKGLSTPIKIISFEYTIPEFFDKAIECIKLLQELGTIVCNFSPAETLQFGLDEWLKAEDFIKIFRKLPSKGIIDGDIYVKYLDI